MEKHAFDPACCLGERLQTLSRAELTALAEADKIPYQYEILVAGGTDTSSMQTAGAGAHAGAVSIPTRYVHSPVEVVDAKDLDACVKLLRAAVERGINAEK